MEQPAFAGHGLGIPIHGQIVLTNYAGSATTTRISQSTISVPSSSHALLPGNWRVPLRFPTASGLARTKPVILWLRIGDLRLADNRAVAAVAHSSHSVLPVVTVHRTAIDNALRSALRDLQARLVALGSTLLIRVVDCTLEAEVSVICRVAESIHAGSVYANFRSRQDSSVLYRLRKGGIMVKLCGEVMESVFSGSGSIKRSFLHNAPQSFPSPPASSKTMASDLEVEGVSCQGETVAWTRLSRLVRAQTSSSAEAFQQALILSDLSEELRLGCLSRDRVLQEFKLHSAGPPAGRRRLPSAINALFSNFKKTPAYAALSVAAYDVNGGDRRGVEWDEETKSFQLKEWEHTETERRMNPQERVQEFLRRRRLFLMRSFFPEDVTPDYYSFTAWRFAQRCVSATIGVFGTSSLLLALGIRSGRIGQAAVISWVLKDGLGRVGKMLWAGGMGKDFDVDPKRWRFRSALLYALGNGLEIVTQIFPASFLVFATAANSMKQVSMITSSATRNAMYRSFGGRSQNIANITAKGEAQITIADLIGMACGIRLSKVVGTSKMNVLGSYAALTVLDIFGIYMELRMVVFRTLNAERSHFVVEQYLKNGQMLSPPDVSPKESIFLKPRYMNSTRLSSIAKAAKTPEELELLLRVFRREHFMVSTPGPGCGPCRVVLRKDASNEDVLRAFLLVGYVQKCVKSRDSKEPLTLDERESILRTARKLSKRNFPSFLEGVRDAGWNTDNLLFGTLKRRGYWGRESH